MKKLFHFIEHISLLHAPAYFLALVGAILLLLTLVL